MERKTCCETGLETHFPVQRGTKMLLALGIVCVIQLALTLSHPSEIEAPNSYIRNTLDRLLMDVDEFFNWIVGNSQFYGKFKVSEPQLLMMMQTPQKSAEYIKQ